MSEEMLEVVEHITCRLCGCGGMETAFTLGEQYISNFVPAERVDEGRKAPLEVVMCHNCSLVQLRHTAPQELLYSRFYWYRSGVTETMRAALREVSALCEEIADLEAGDVVLDIGANDGTLLGTYTVPGLTLVGCEPADNLIDLLREKTDHVIHDFWLRESYERHAAGWGIGKAKVVTALGMFYDLEDPNQFIADIAAVLDDDGIFIAQLMCLATMLEKNDLGNLCHEHIEFYSLESLRYLFENNGLEIFEIEENEVNGGSYRIFARHLDQGSIPIREKITIEDLRAFKTRIDETREECVAFIEDEVAKGKSVWVYGASTKGNVILQHYGLDTRLIGGASERSPEKWGKYTIGSGIPIVSEEEARAARPDYFLVLPYAFFDEMYERESEWRAQGGKFLVPLPDFRVVA